MATSKVCEACEHNAASVVEPCDDTAFPYLLCHACHRRLHEFALRPSEWYNLARRHGVGFMIHDDFYDQNGVACQAEQPVDAAQEHAAPQLADVADSPRRLLEFSVARGGLDAEVETALSRFAPDEVLAAVSALFGQTTNPVVLSQLLWSAAKFMGPVGANFVRDAWAMLPQDVATLTHVSIHCLPVQEGFERTTAALSKLSIEQRRIQLWCLDCFHTPATLDWIEKNLFEPSAEMWGLLAAASNADWPRLARWLESDRPLSIVALDTLSAIADPQSEALRAYGPRLHEPPSRETLERALTDHLQRDPVPRVQKRVRALLQMADKLCQHAARH